MSGVGHYRAKAESLAIRFHKRSIPLDREAVRDEVDLSTGGELDCTQLDILSDMVFDRMKRASI